MVNKAPSDVSPLPFRAMAAAQLLAHLVAGGLVIAADFDDPDDVLAVWFVATPFLAAHACALGWLVARSERRLIGRIGSRAWALVGAAGATMVTAFLPLILWGVALFSVGLVEGSGRLMERSVLPAVPGVFVVGVGLVLLFTASRMRSGGSAHRDRVGLSDIAPTSTILFAWVAGLSAAPALGLVAALCNLSMSASAPLVVLALAALAGTVAWGTAKVPTTRTDAAPLRWELAGATLLGGLTPLFMGALLPFWDTNHDARWSLIALLLVLMPVGVALWSTGRALRQDIWLPEPSPS